MPTTVEGRQTPSERRTIVRKRRRDCRSHPRRLSPCRSFTSSRVSANVPGAYGNPTPRSCIPDDEYDEAGASLSLSGIGERVLGGNSETRRWRGASPTPETQFLKGAGGDL